MDFKGFIPCLTVEAIGWYGVEVLKATQGNSGRLRVQPVTGDTRYE